MMRHATLALQNEYAFLGRLRGQAEYELRLAGKDFRDRELAVIDKMMREISDAIYLLSERPTILMSRADAEEAGIPIEEGKRPCKPATAIRTSSPRSAR